MIGDHAEIPDWIVPGYYPGDAVDPALPPDNPIGYNLARHVAAALCHASMDLFGMPDAPESVEPAPLAPPLIVRTSESPSPEDAAADFLAVAKRKGYLD